VRDGSRFVEQVRRAARHRHEERVARARSPGGAEIRRALAFLEAGRKEREQGKEQTDGLRAPHSSYCYAYDTYWPGCFGTESTRGTSGVSLLETSRGFLFACTAQGGKGGRGSDAGGCCLGFSLPCDTPCQPAGSGVTVSTAAQLVMMDLQASGGSFGCPPGTPLAGLGSKTELQGDVGDYSITGTVQSGGSAQLVFRGPPGWNVFLTYSGEYAPVYLPEFKGYSVVDPNSPTIFIGQMPLSGQLTTSVPFRLPRNELAQVLYSQAKFYDLNTGQPYMGSASAMLVLREPCP
jgi:hypothetical protein